MILVLYVVFPRQLIGIFDPGPDDAVSSGPAHGPDHAAHLHGGMYVTVEAIVVVFIGHPARRR